MIRRHTLIALLFAMPLLPSLAAAAPEEGKPFKDWIVKCEKQLEAKEGGEKGEIKVCYIVQNLMLKEGNRQLLNVKVGYLPNSGQVAAIFTLPLGFHLPPGVSLKIDEEEAVTFPVQHCIKSGCMAALPVEEELLYSMKMGGKGYLTFMDGTRRSVSIPFSLDGFTAAFNSLK